MKSRECCQQLMVSYEQAREAQTQNHERGAPVETLKAAETAATEMLRHLKSLPARPCSSMSAAEDRLQSSEILADIRNMLERTMQIEEEIRRGGGNMPALEGMFNG